MSRPGQLAWRRLRADRVGWVSLWLVLASLVLVAAAALGLVGGQWDSEVAPGHAPPAWATSLGWEAPVPPRAAAAIDAEPTPVPGIDDPIGDSLASARADLAGKAVAVDPLHPAWLAMGADSWGRDVLAKTFKGAQTSILVGLGAALFATLLGTLLGMLAGFVGGWLDDLLNWVYNVFTSVPTILLILAIAAALGQRSLAGVVVILACTSWTGVFRLIRAEYLKHSVRDYVRAARAIGASPMRRMVVHILPNVAHLVLVQFSLLTVSCIKSEVILSFLGFGVPVDGVSWGTMLTEAQNDLLVGKWWQLLSASLAMAVFVTALALLTDAVRDAFDPKLRR